MAFEFLKKDNTNPTLPEKNQNSLHRFRTKSAYSKSVLSLYFLSKNFYIFFLVRICSFGKKAAKVERIPLVKIIGVSKMRIFSQFLDNSFRLIDPVYLICKQSCKVPGDLPGDLLGCSKFNT